MSKANQPEHYNDVVKLFTSYYVARSIITNHTRESLKKLDNNEALLKSYDDAERVVRLVDNAIVRINFICKNGNRYARALFYRYMTDRPYSEDAILERLRIEGIAKSKPTYHRLKEKGLYAACAFIYNDNVELNLIQNLNIPT